MNLTTLERVMKLDNQLPDQKDKDMINIIIAGVSAKVVTYLGRTIEKTTHVEYFDVSKFTESSISLSAIPVVRDAEIAPGVPNPFAVKNRGVLIPTDKVEINFKRGIVKVRKDGSTFDPFTWSGNANYAAGATLIEDGLEAIEVTYFGGMATDTADFIAKFPDIEYEVMLQVIFEYKRKKNLAMVSVGAGGNSSETYTEFTLRKELKRALRPHRRATGIA